MKKPYGIVVFAFLLSAVMLGVVGLFGYKLVRQSATTGWTATPATVLSSSVATSRGSRGKKNYRAAITYAYTVSGVECTSDTVELATFFSSGSRLSAEALVRQHAAGQSVTAYVNPSDPTEAVLVRGTSKRHWQVATFVSVFVAVPIIPWMFAVRAWRVRGPGHIGTVRVFEPVPGVWVVRNPGIGPWAAAAIAFFACLALSTLAGVLVLSDWPREAMAGGWSLAVALAAMAGVWRWRWIKQGRADTVIDLGAGVLIPARKGSRAAEAIPLAQVSGTRLRQDSATATNKQNHFRVHVAINGKGKGVPIGDIRHRADAETFQAWLRRALGLGDSPANADEPIELEPPTEER